MCIQCIPTIVYAGKFITKPIMDLLHVWFRTTCACILHSSSWLHQWCMLTIRTAAIELYLQYFDWEFRCGTVSAGMSIKSHNQFLEVSCIAIKEYQNLIPQLQGWALLYEEPKSSYNHIKDFGLESKCCGCTFVMCTTFL